MANMIPNTPKKFAPGSLEDVMFKSLEDLPEEYYVFHSFSLLTLDGNTICESETDFVIYSRQKGIICLEAKAGHVKYVNGYMAVALKCLMTVHIIKHEETNGNSETICYIVHTNNLRKDANSFTQYGFPAYPKRS